MAQLAKLLLQVTLARAAVMWELDLAGAPTWLSHRAGGLVLAVGWELNQGASVLFHVSASHGFGFSQHGSWFQWAGSESYQSS